MTRDASSAGGRLEHTIRTLASWSCFLEWVPERGDPLEKSVELKSRKVDGLWKGIRHEGNRSLLLSSSMVLPVPIRSRASQ